MIGTDKSQYYTLSKSMVAVRANEEPIERWTQEYGIYLNTFEGKGIVSKNTQRRGLNIQFLPKKKISEWRGKLEP